LCRSGTSAGPDRSRRSETVGERFRRLDAFVRRPVTRLVDVLQEGDDVSRTVADQLRVVRCIDEVGRSGLDVLCQAHIYG
jgi:hypothetical protein